MPGGAPPPVQFSQLSYASPPSNSLGQQMQQFGKNLKSSGLFQQAPVPADMAPGSAVPGGQGPISAGGPQGPISAGGPQGPISAGGPQGPSSAGGPQGPAPLPGHQALPGSPYSPQAGPVAPQPPAPVAPPPQQPSIGGDLANRLGPIGLMDFLKRNIGLPGMIPQQTPGMAGNALPLAAQGAGMLQQQPPIPYLPGGGG